MKIIYSCFPNLSGTSPRLEAYTNFSRQDWANWIAASNLETLVALLEACTDAKDFTFGRSDGIVFSSGSLLSSTRGYIDRAGHFGDLDGRNAVPNGFVGFQSEGKFTAIVPVCAFYGFLQTICQNVIQSLLPDSKDQGIAALNEAEARHIKELEVEIGKLTLAFNYQGTLSFQTLESNREWGKVMESQTCFEPSENWLPFLDCEYLFDRFHIHGAILARNAADHNDAAALDSAIQSRKVILETLKVARLFGKEIPEEIYSLIDNPNAPASKIIQSYHRLLLHANSRESNPDSVPFSIDWFHHLERLLPAGFDLTAVNMELEKAWRMNPVHHREKREINALDWRFKVVIDDLGSGQFGYASLYFAEELD